MSSIRLKHASGNSMSLAAPGTNPASNLELKLPHTIGSANQLLKVDGSGQLGWATDSTTDSTKLPLAGGTLTGTLNVDSGSSGMIDFGDTGSAFGRLYADSTGTFVGSKTQHVLWLRTNNVQRIKVSDTSAATSIGGAFTFNAMLTTQGDISGGLLMLKASENTNRFFVSGNDTSGCEVNLYDDAGSQKGIVGVSSSEFFLKAPNNSAPLTFYTHNGSSIGERLRISATGKIGIGEVAPTNMLHVKAGDTGVSSFDARYHITVENNGEAYLGFYVPDSSFAGIRFSDTTGTEGYIDYYFNTDEMVYYSTGLHKWSAGGSNRLTITSAGVIQCGTSGTLKAEINNSVNGHYFVSQCDDNNNGFEIYQQHGSTTSRNTLAVYNNSTGSKHANFYCRGDNQVFISTNKNSIGLVMDGTSSGTAYGETGATIDFSMLNEVNQFTGNPAARIASYLQRGNNGFGLKFFCRNTAGTFFNSLDLTADYHILPGVNGVADVGSDSKYWRRSYVQNAYPILSTVQNITGSSFSNQGWYDTGFRRDSMGGLDTNGTYIITGFADTHAAGGGNYSCTYTWIVGIKDQYTNQSTSNDIPLLSVTGHSTNGQVLALRTVRQNSNQGGMEWIQWKASQNWTSLDNSSSGRILRFTAQRIGRVYT